ncbi:YnfC family lipoprotein [Shigella sonnei]
MDCQLIIVDEGVKPTIERVYTIGIPIDYYSCFLCSRLQESLTRCFV